MKLGISLAFIFIVGSVAVNAATEKETEMFGWLASISYSDRANPLLAEMGLKNANIEINVGVGGVTGSLLGEIKCNVLYLDSSVPEIEGIPVKLSGALTAQQVSQAFRPYLNTFVKLNNVQVIKNRNQNYCKVSSISVIEDPVSTKVTILDADNRYVRRVFDVVVRAGIGSFETYTHLVRNGMEVKFDPIKYDCNQYQWATAEAAKVMEDKFQKNKYQNLKSAKVEFANVRPINKIGRCVFDGMRIVANDDVANETPQVVTSDNTKDDSLFFESIEVLVSRVKPSLLEQCKKSNPEYHQQVCTKRGETYISPILTFKISGEERNRINLRTLSTYKRGYWKEGFIPEYTDRIKNLNGKKIRLVNVRLAHARTNGYFFESVVDLEP